MWDDLALSYLLVSRTAYVLGVGIALWQQRRHKIFTRRYGVEQGYQRFRRIASLLMLNDGVAFVLLCVVSADTLDGALPRTAEVAAGLLLCLVGVTTKTWAAVRLGSRAYYWYNFFGPSVALPPNPSGPYRYLKNPMYVVGYLHTYGLALVTASLPGLVASAFMQGTILLFNELVERPHFESLLRSPADEQR